MCWQALIPALVGGAVSYYSAKEQADAAKAAALKPPEPAPEPEPTPPAPTRETIDTTSAASQAAADLRKRQKQANLRSTLLTGGQGLGGGGYSTTGVTQRNTLLGGGR
ncbi:MAG: hypothetical protein QM330_00535 [Acidobacteriota bacterium]|nr:hypothetical protein [Acidobacteriota bacterium]